MEEDFKFPVDIPWRLIDVSSDMIDERFCNRRFPPPWRSSIAVFAYEPSIEELPKELCEDRLLYLKISCSLTGYQPTQEEINDGFITFDKIPEEVLTDVFSRYYACYGALVNIAVFGGDKIFEREGDGFPHIVNFEPKMRDMYQAATETGQILSASSSDVKVGKSYANTQKTESGWNISGKYETGGLTLAGGLDSKQTDTHQDTFSVNTDRSQERRETETRVTNLNQMYNLLTGYHLGTNRATFLMLPRPHVLQATDKRTFVQGLRVLEGVQDFFLVTSRPRAMSSMRVEVSLETGHFPEHEDQVIAPEPKYEYKEVIINIWETIRGITWGGTVRLNEVRHGFEVDGWTFDPNRGETGRGGIEYVDFMTTRDMDQAVRNTMTAYDYRVQSPDTVTITATFDRDWFSSELIFGRRYRVFLRRRIPSTTPTANVGNMIITRRKLCTEVLSVEKEGVPCVQKKGPLEFIDPGNSVIVGERAVLLSPQAVQQARDGYFQPAIKEGLAEIRRALTTPLPTRYEAGVVSLGGSQYLSDKLVSFLPQDLTDTILEELVDSQEWSDPKMCASDFLRQSNYTISRSERIGLAAVVKLRQEVLKALHERY